MFGGFVGSFISLGRQRRLEPARDHLRGRQPRRARLHQEDRRRAQEHPQEPAALRRQPGARRPSSASPNFAGNFLDAPQDRADRLAHRLAARGLHPEGLHAGRDRQVRPLGARPDLGQHPRRSWSRRSARPAVKALETGFDIVVTLVTRGAGRGVGQDQGAARQPEGHGDRRHHRLRRRHGRQEGDPEADRDVHPRRRVHLGDHLDLRHHHGLREQDHDRSSRSSPASSTRSSPSPAARSAPPRRGSRRSWPACCRSPSASSPASPGSARSPTRSWA